MEFKEKAGKFLKKNSKKFTKWFNYKEHPRSKLNEKVFLYDLLKFIGFILVFLIINSNLESLNNIVLIFIKLGATLQLVSLYFVIRKGVHLVKNLKYWVRGLSHGMKIVFLLIIVFLLFFTFLNQAILISSIENRQTKMEFNEFVPFQLEGLNLSLDFSKVSNSFNACPQIDVPMKTSSWYGLNIKGQTYDGWTIHGDATCKKGNKEGENLNYYYCGGYSNGLLGGTVNAYIQKTPIASDGSIGKTTKHIIWNIYDENKNFMQTKCLGDPDEYEKKQARELRESMESGEWFFGG